MELVKREDHYGLYNEDGHKIAATIDGCNSKLSKENCDEIFGVTDTEKLADEYCTHEPKNVKELRDVNLIKLGFRDGFNKAMELNKDKLVTIKELKIIMLELFYLEKNEDEAEDMFRERQLAFIENNIQSLQQPTEIEVEIEVLLTERDGGVVIETPKLDKDGCLILTKKK